MTKLTRKLLAITLGVCLCGTSAFGGTTVYANDYAEPGIEAELQIEAQGCNADEVELNEQNFPDKILRDYLEANYDENENGLLCIAERRSVLHLGGEYIDKPDGFEVTVDNSLDGVKNFKGIEVLPYLQTLIISGNEAIEELDISRNTALEYIDVSACSKLKTLNVTSNIKLKGINVANTSISEVDTSANKELESFVGNGSKNLSGLDFTNNSKLRFIDLNGTSAGNINTKRMANLYTFRVADTRVDSLDFTSNPELRIMDAAGCSNLASLDITKNPELLELVVSGTGIEKLDISKNTALSSLDVSNTIIKSLDISACKATLTKLAANNTRIAQLTNLDLCNYNNLDTLYINNAGVDSIKFNDKVSYNEVSIDDNKLAQIKAPGSETSVNYGRQTVDLVLPEESEGRPISLNTLVDDTARVAVVESEDYRYNPETTTVELLNSRGIFDYIYQITDEDSMYVTVKVSYKDNQTDADNDRQEEIDKQTATIVKLSAPSRVRGKAGKKRAYLTWKAPSTIKVDGYKVYRSTKKSSGYKVIYTGKSTKYTAKKLKKGRTYYFKVRGYKKVAGKTIYTKAVRVKVKAK